MINKKLLETKEDLKIRRLMLEIEELTLYLKENHSRLVNAFKQNEFHKNKDIEIAQLTLENLGYQLKGLLEGENE